MIVEAGWWVHGGSLYYSVSICVWNSVSIKKRNLKNKWQLIWWFPDLSLELWTHVPKCQLDLSSLMSNRHLKLHQKLSSWSPPLSQTFSCSSPPMSEHANSIFPLAQTGSLRVILDFSIFTPHPICQQILLPSLPKPPSSAFLITSVAS